MKASKTKKLVVSALFAALVCIATLVIHIPIPATNGYINLGDCIVLLSGFILGPVWGTAAAAIGSALSDAILGYTLYIPATFIIKGAVALGASALYRFPKTGLLRAPIAGIAGEIIMIIGYYLYESILYGFAGAAAGIPGNAIQAFAGIILSSALVMLLGKIKGIERILKI